MVIYSAFTGSVGGLELYLGTFNSIEYACECIKANFDSLVLFDNSEPDRNVLEYNEIKSRIGVDKTTCLYSEEGQMAFIFRSELNENFLSQK